MKRVFVIPGANKEELESFREAIENNELVIIGGELKVYVIRDNDLFEVVNDLKFVQKLEVEE